MTPLTILLFFLLGFACLELLKKSNIIDKLGIVYLAIMGLLIFYGFGLRVNADEPLEFGNRILEEMPQTINIRYRVDLDRLSHAVACAETSCGKRGAALSKNNHHGIMRFYIEDGKRKRYLASYEDHSQSYAEFKSVWRRLYGGRCPTIKDVKKYTGNDSPDTWLANTLSVYDCRGLAPYTNS